MDISDPAVKERFRKASRGGKITCGECLRIVNELNVPSKKVAPMLSLMGIKIIGCQLGCFP